MTKNKVVTSGPGFMLKGKKAAIPKEDPPKNEVQQFANADLSLLCSSTDNEKEAKEAKEGGKTVEVVEQQEMKNFETGFNSLEMTMRPSMARDNVR